MTNSGPKSNFQVNDQEWAKELELSVESYTDSLMNKIYEGDAEEVLETESGEPFCGCNRCFWRETLVYLVPRLLQGHEKGKVVLNK